MKDELTVNWKITWFPWIFSGVLEEERPSSFVTKANILGQRSTISVPDVEGSHVDVHHLCLLVYSFLYIVDDTIKVIFLASLAASFSFTACLMVLLNPRTKFHQGFCFCF